ncbi:MAG: heme peroxidase, partial [Methylibium sp.]|nr:heme peroxidase [Methylibium sp.]
MKLIKSDLEFMLEQIKISEAHAAGGTLLGQGPNQIPDELLPFGVRTVDGTFNNLISGRSGFGAADRPLPRMLTPDYRDGEGAPAGFFGPGSPEGPQTFYQTPGTVFDSQPRMISNLILDQTAGNPAAVAAQNRHDSDEVSSDGTLFIPNIAPDEGLSAPFNSWMTLFGQFFDHGLSLTNKGAGSVFIPLKPDDPLYDADGADNVANSGDEANFMVLSRADNSPGINQTTPFVDQNQTYTSHPSHQVFLREYEFGADGKTVATGRMLSGADDGDPDSLGDGLATWAQVKAHAATFLGIVLSDADVLNVPLLATDEYGRFERGPNGFAQIVLSGNTLLEGSAAGVAVPANALRTGHAFLDDIAHHAAPGRYDSNGDHVVNGSDAFKTPDADGGTTDDGLGSTYDDELLDAHFITGDGRGNENIGLTAVHHVFHSEHNRLVEDIKAQITATGDAAFISQWKLPDGSWNGERVFQAARFGTEMQCQHLVFEEFARKIQPQVDVFAGYDVDIDPAITAEFAHTVYRFGHSMLTDTMGIDNGVFQDVVNDGEDDVTQDIGLIEAFLNPVKFNQIGGALGADEAAEQIIRGMTRQTGNHIDEFVTDALRNNLVGLPLDLATINIARGRETGIPGLQAARQQFYDATSDSSLQPYDDWLDFRTGIKNPESLINFVAAYGTHASITGQETAAGKRAAAQAIVSNQTVTLTNDPDNPDDDVVFGPPSDRTAFLEGTGIYAANKGGLNDVDFWIGGLAEKTSPFGGMLGSTFNFVFETQMEKLQDGDRMYYLSRTAGLNFLTELEGNSFAELIMRNLPGVKHLPGDVFSVPNHSFEISDNRTWSSVVAAEGESFGLVTGVHRYVGGGHVVIGGTAGNDNMRSDIGDDTLWGDGGNDRLEGGAGNDSHNGGDGNDIITDSFGDDNFKGGNGNDAINSGPGIDLILGGEGKDFLVAGGGLVEIFAGRDDDFVLGGTATDTVFGGEGDDWIQGGNQADLLQGDNGDPFQLSTLQGNDVIFGDGGNDDYDSESGDDIMISGSGTERMEGQLGFDWTIHKGDTAGANADLLRSILLPPTVEPLRDRFDQTEALSGWNFNDTLRGDNRLTADLTAIQEGSGGQNNAINNAAQIALIRGLAEHVLGIGATAFSGGNILLGGGGNDLIEGRDGDDILDGDAWLNVRLEERLADGTPVASHDSMTAVQTRVFAGTLDPGNLHIVREILIAAGGNDRLDGGLGNDVMRGRAGDDTYVVDSAGDQVIELVGEGNDTIESSATFALAAGASIENLTLTGAAAINGTGNELANRITGNAAANVLNGLGGIDTLIGGAGNDTYVVDGTGDVVTEALNEGTDLVQVIGATASYTLGANVENLTRTGAGAFAATGNELGNRLQTNGGADTLLGLGGNDTLLAGGGNDLLDGGTGADSMSGQAGNDTYVVDNTGDTVVEAAGGGTDTVQTTLGSYALGANVENLTYTGASTFTGTGNGLGNTLIGGAAANTLSGLDG